MDIMIQSALTTIGSYFVIAIAFILAFFINWVVRRINCIVLCQVEIMNGLKELGINGDIKKRYDALIEQIARD